MAGTEEDISSVVECLVSMFGSLLNREAIISIVESCGGDLNLSVDAVMKITTESSEPAEHTQSNIVSNQDVPVVGSIQSNYENQFTSQNVISGHYPMNIPNVTHMQQQPPTYAVHQSPSNTYSMATQVENLSQPTPPPSYQSHGAVPKMNNQVSSPYKAPWDAQIRRIIENHNRGVRVLVLMRGAPGSGKTHLAQKLVDMLVGGTYTNYKTHICSTDDYFMYRGKYHFNRHNLSEAHAWNQDRVKVATRQGLSPIIIDNTNIEIWEMEFYARNGVENGYILEVVEPNTPWAKKPNQLVKRNIHNVPLMNIKRMIDNYIENITGESLITYYKLKYPRERQPPVLRVMPAVQFELENKILPNVNPVACNVAASTSKNVDVAEITRIEQVMSNTVLSPGPSEPQTTKDSRIEKTDIPKVIQNTNTQEANNQNPYSQIQKQLEEIEKVEIEWDNGESWEEGQEVACSVNKDITTKSPKPQRANSPKSEKSSDKELLNVVNTCQDWRQISLFMPPWNDETPQSTSSLETVVETKSSATCMELGDFDWTKTSHKIITACPRNINEFHISFQRERIPEMRMLDKSTTTTEISLTDNSRRCKNEESHFIAFRKLFTNVSKAALRDVFDQCMGDVNWAVEIVLDGMAANQFDIVNEEEIDEEDDVKQELCTCLSSYNIVPDSSPEPNVTPEQDNIGIVAASTECTAVVPKKNSKKDIKTSDASLQLKRQIEQNVVIAETHYSKHCLKLRKWRHGETDDETVQTVPDDEQPSTSQGLQTSGDACGPDNNDQNSDDDEDSTISSVEELEKTVNINLGREFITELDALFGRSDMSYPDSLMPKINIPLSLLNEINALWMESLMHQLDEHERQATKMLQEDEEFARILAVKEAELALVGKEPEVLDFKEIMDMDYALSLYQRDVAEWKNKEPNDLAAKLTREKLYNLFPEVPKEVLAELLMAHDNNFQSTVEGLLVSTGKAHLLEEKNGINNFVTQKEMERQQKILEEEKKALSEVEWPLLPKGEVPDMEVVNGYRDNADRHLHSRDVNFQKANEYVRRGMLTVGGYYRQLAEFHKLKYEQSNSLAAASLMQLHAAKCPDSATIDLHYLRVGEAKESLDLFIDTHIQKLKSTPIIRHHTLYFITGRGLHSNGRPRIKPAVKKRLRERGLIYHEVNPGLLSAKVTADDRLTHQIA